MPKKKAEEESIKTTPNTKTKTPAKGKTTQKQSKQKASSKRANGDPPLPFEVGSYIFYPHEGLGHIKNLEYRKFHGEDTLYYEIFFESQKMISHIPVKNVKLLKLRKVISKTNAQKVLKVLATKNDSVDLSWKDRLNLYQEILKKGSALEMAEIVSTLYVRKRAKPLSFQERQYYEFALEALVGEIAVAFHIQKEQANEKVYAALEIPKSKS